MQTSTIRLSLFGLLLLLSKPNEAQTIDYFANNPQWRQNSACSFGNYPCIRIEDFVYYINGDTTYNSQVYKKVFKRGTFLEKNNEPSPLPSNCPTGRGNFDTLAGFVRQEGQKIYGVDFWYSSAEILFYDFGLNIGDTIILRFGSGIVNGIDSILIGGDYRRITYFSLMNTTDISWLVEGIGHKNGLLEPFTNFLECGYAMYCYSLDDTTRFYSDTTLFSSQNCFFNVSLMENKELTMALNVYPNPASEQLIIQQLNTSHQGKMEVYSLNGQLLDRTIVEEEPGTYKLDVSTFRKGMYILKVKYNSGILSRKFVVD